MARVTAGERPAALVFDFDGTILDTETPTYEAWKQTFVHYGAEPIGFDEWVKSIGLSDRQFDQVDLLGQRLGRPVDRDEVQEVRRVIRDAELDRLTLRPGVQRWVDAASAAGIPLGIASSSSRAWVEPHLIARGLRPRFKFLACARDVLEDGTEIPGKPDPTSYRLACEALGADPAQSLAIEDSPHGVTAANQAGMLTIAVPGPMTAHLDFSHADIVVDALTELTLDGFPWGSQAA